MTNIEDIITGLGEDLGRDGLKDTPKRYAKQLKECLSGYDDDPLRHLTLFPSEGYQGLVTVGDISFSSMCEHHLLPFFGYVHIGYVPSGKILGLSKFARVVDAFSKRLQVQERLTGELADFLYEQLQPELLLIRIEADHTCMIVRGVSRPESHTATFMTRGDTTGQEHILQQFAAGE